MDRKIIEKIAAGLRKADGKRPNMILVDISWINGIPESDITESEVCGIPLVKVDLTGFSESDDKDCPFIPVYSDEDRGKMDIYWFRRGYEEY